MSYYRYGIDWQIGPASLDPEIAYPVSKNNAARSVKATDPPFFFGIDCRNEEEKAMGRYTSDEYEENCELVV